MAIITGLNFSYNDKSNSDQNTFGFPTECSFSYGQTLETSTKFSYDFTGTSQASIRCKRLMAKTYSVSFTLFRPFTLDLFEAAAKIEDCVGKLAHLYLNGLDLGLVIVMNAAINMITDSIDGLSSLGISLELREGLEPKKKAQRVNIETIRR